MSRIAKNLSFCKISYVEITTKDDNSLYVEIQDERGGILHLDMDYQELKKLAGICNEMAKEVRG